MYIRSTWIRSARLSVAVAMFVVAALAAGCTESDLDAPEPTPTPGEHHGPPHSIMQVGSTEHDGGQLVVNEVPIAYVVASACLGGTGDECTGGTVAYTGDSPGFNDVRDDDQSATFNKLPDGTTVSIEIISVEADSSVLVSGVLLDTAAETAVVNTSPELHNHPTWQIVAPGGTAPAAKQISFRLHAEGFESSDEITVTIEEFDEHAEPTPTPTPGEHHGPPHSIMEVGSTTPGGGTITTGEVPTAFVVASACLGGTGDECTGGTVVYTGDSPGFNDVRTEDPNLPLYKFPDGVTVSIEITAVDENASVLVSETLLDTVGETAVVNTSPELHNHPTWQIALPAGEEVEDLEISFRLHATGYTSSEEMTVTLSLFEEDDDHEDDDAHE